MFLYVILFALWFLVRIATAPYLHVDIIDYEKRANSGDGLQRLSMPDVITLRNSQENIKLETVRIVCVEFNFNLKY